MFLKESATTQKHEKAARIILKNPKGSFAKKMKESGKIWKDLGKIKKSEEIQDNQREFERTWENQRESEKM